jgi:hypothetical protein
MIDFLDLGFKLTYALMDFADILYNTAVFEVVVFFLNVLFFLSNKNDS